MKVAVLDDYQAVAADFADWSSLPADTEVVYFHDHLSDEDALVERLQSFHAVAGMRERTAFPRSVLSRLPELRLLITTGGRNAVFDVAAATDLGIVVAATGGAGEGPTELTWGLIIGLLRQIPVEDQRTREGGWEKKKKDKKKKIKKNIKKREKENLYIKNKKTKTKSR